MMFPLEVQAGFARGVGQGFHPSVEDVAAAIEDDVLDALFDGALGDELADQGGRVLVRALGRTFTLEGGGRARVTPRSSSMTWA
jgi:hypothetical protein